MSNIRINNCLIPLILLLSISACNQLSPPLEVPQEFSESTTSSPTPRVIQTPLPTDETFQGTISIRHAWDETEVPTLAAIIKSFQSYYPDVLFEVLSIPADTLLERYIADSNAGMGATILLGPAEWSHELYHAGVVADFTEDLDSTTLDMLNQAALASGRVENALIGLPYTISGVVLFRNTDLITINADSFDNLTLLAQTSSQGRIIGAYLERSFFYSGAHLIGLGGQIIDENNLPGFNNGKGVAWLQLLKDFELAGPVNYFSDDDLERFKLGEIGWIIDGTWHIDDLGTAIGKENLAVDPWPAVDNGSMAGFVRSENIYLSSQAEAPEYSAAIKFIQFLVSPEAQSRLAELGRVPANYQFTMSDPIQYNLMMQTIEALKGGAAYPVHPEMAIYNLNLDLALRAYFDEGLPPERVLQSAQDAILAELARIKTPEAP